MDSRLPVSLSGWVAGLGWCVAGQPLAGWWQPCVTAFSAARSVFCPVVPVRVSVQPCPFGCLSSYARLDFCLAAPDQISVLLPVHHLSASTAPRICRANHGSFKCNSCVRTGLQDVYSCSQLLIYIFVWTHIFVYCAGTTWIVVFLPEALRLSVFAFVFFVRPQHVNEQ